MDASSKRRKIEADGGEINPPRRSESVGEEAAAVELESCSSVSEAGENEGARDSSNLISSDQRTASPCVSSSGSVVETEDETKCVNLECEGNIVVVAEEETSSERDGRGPMRSETGGGKVKRSETGGPAGSQRSDLQGGSAARILPESELDEFFSGAEKQVQQRFTEKYNYDLVNDVPLSEGRYEWTLTTESSKVIQKRKSTTPFLPIEFGEVRRGE